MSSLLNGYILKQGVMDLSYEPHIAYTYQEAICGSYDI